MIRLTDFTSRSPHLQRIRNEAIRFKLFPPEDEDMSRIEYLQHQAARAERLAKEVFDRLTVERLQSFAAECRAQIRELTGNRMETA